MVVADIGFYEEMVKQARGQVWTLSRKLGEARKDLAEAKERLDKQRGQK